MKQARIISNIMGGKCSKYVISLGEFPVLFCFDNFKPLFIALIQERFHGMKCNCLWNSKITWKNIYLGYVLIFLLIDSVISRLLFKTDVVKPKKFTVQYRLYLMPLKCYIPTILKHFDEI